MCTYSVLLVTFSVCYMIVDKKQRYNCKFNSLLSGLPHAVTPSITCNFTTPWNLYVTLISFNRNSMIVGEHLQSNVSIVPAHLKHAPRPTS